MSPVRDLRRGLGGLALALGLLVVTGGLGPGGPGWLKALAAGLALISLWIATRPPLHPAPPEARPHDRARLRGLVRGLGILALGVEALRLDPPWLEVLDLAVYVPFVVALGQLVLAHVRRGTALHARLTRDATLVGVLLAAGAVVRLVGSVPDWFHAPPGGLLFVLASATFVIGGLRAGTSLPLTLAALKPEPLPTTWRHLARDAIRLDTPHRFEAHIPVAGDATVHVCVERDPLPPRTHLTLPLPVLAGISAHVRAHGEPTGAPLRDDVLDAALHVDGPPGPLRRAIDAARAEWIRVLHGWRASLDDGVLHVTFDGATPRPAWIGARRDIDPDAVLHHALDDLAVLAASAHASER